ncbi:MAG: hypothetical protein ACK5O2_13740 [Microthrixaceae bacterium]
MARQRLDRAATERVLRRAVELSEEPGDGEDSFDVQALVEAAAELGVPPTAVQRAVAEDQAGILTQDGSRLDRVVGPAAVSAARVVPLDPAAALDLTDEWLRRQWAFRRVRSGDAVAEYRRRTDMVASMQRTARSVTGRENGDKIRNLRVVVRDLAPVQHGSAGSGPSAGEPGVVGSDPGEGGTIGVSVLALVVDLEASRSFAEMGGALVAGGGSVLSVIPAFGVGPWTLLGIPVSAGMGAGVMLTRKAWTGGIDVALEGLLDLIEAGQAPPSVIGGIAGRIRRPA